MLLCHIQSKVARKSRFDGKQTCRLAFIFLICFGGGGGGGVLGFVLFLISLSWFRPCNAAKKGSSNTERGKLDWMGNKPWITCICRLASCARSSMLTIIKIKLKLHWFAIGQIFNKRWKDNANTYDTQQFISVRLWRINTWYSDIFKIQKVKPFNQQTTVL